MLPDVQIYCNVRYTDATGVFKDMINAGKKDNNNIKNIKNLFSILD